MSLGWEIAIGFAVIVQATVREDDARKAGVLPAILNIFFTLTGVYLAASGINELVQS